MKLQAKHAAFKLNQTMHAYNDSGDARKLKKALRIAKQSGLQISSTVAYTINQLDDKAKQYAIDKWLNNYQFDDFCTLYDVKTVLELMGFNCEIQYSGFYSQGDGAAICGDYAYKKGAASAIKNYAPQDKDLHNIATALQKLQSKHLYKLSANLTTSNRGNYTTINEVLRNGNYYDNSDTEADLRDIIGDLNHWIYKQLESAYEWDTSEASVIECIEANEYKFDASGKML